MILDTYITLEATTVGQFKEKGSQFWAYGFPIILESDVKHNLEQLRKEHPKSRHLCYAYRFGQDKEFHRINDDGEPSGTAGKPILGQLIKNQLENVLLAVVRYFGGTLLGTSGLIRAYKSSTEDAIKNAKLITKPRRSYFRLEFEYPSQKFVEAFINKYEGEIIKTEYGQYINSLIAFPLSKSDYIEKYLQQDILANQWKSVINIKFESKDII